jgi:hypothetical protein
VHGCTPSVGVWFCGELSKAAHILSAFP